MGPEQRLHDFEAALLKALAEGAGVEELRESLRVHGPEFHAFLDAMEPAAVETAVELVAKWGVPSSADE